MDGEWTMWGLRPSDWRMLPWHAFAASASTRLVGAPGVDAKQVTVRVRHQGVVERRLSANRQRQILSPNQSRASAGQFIISKIDARNGACGFVPVELDGAIVTSDFPLYEIRPPVHARYLDHLTALPTFWRLCESVSDGTTNRVRLNPEQFERLPIPVPPWDEQVGIVHTLDSIDAAIEKTEAVIAATGALRKALLQELLTRGVPGWHSEWKTVPGIGTIPACWEVVKLGEVAVVQTGRQVGKPPSRGTPVTVPYLSVANVKAGYLHLDAVKTMTVGAEEVERFRLKAGDVLFNEGGDADKVGRGCVWSGDIDPCLHQNHVFAVRPCPSKLTPWFLTTYASSRAGKDYFLGCAKQTTNLASINSTQLKALPIPMPGIAEQGEIQAPIHAVDSRLQNERRVMTHLRAIKRETASALLSGRVRVVAKAEESR